jgi:hypothetical protein
MAYQIYKELFGSDRFRKLAAQGARVQRLLWASTSTKNPDYSDVKYVEALIGPDAVNTAALETLDAYRDHGDPKARLEQDVKEARWVLERLPELGINIDNVTRQLEDEGATVTTAFDERGMKISPCAEKPAETSILVNVPKLSRSPTIQTCPGGDNVPEWNRKPL